jgi:Fe-S-cluster containining protein
MEGYYHIKSYNDSINIPFICQKCGNCCFPFKELCIHFDLETRLCKNYENRPTNILMNCVDFPIHTDMWYSTPIAVKCKGFLRVMEIIKSLLPNTLIIYSGKGWITENIPESGLLTKNKSRRTKIVNNISNFSFTEQEKELFIELNPNLVKAHGKIIKVVI